MLLKCCTQYTSKFGKLNSGHKTGKGQFSFQSKEKQCQIMFKLLHNCTHLTHQPSNAQNSPSQVSTVCEPWTSRCSSWILENAEEPEIKLPTSVESLKRQEGSRKTSTSALLTMPKSLCGSQQTLENSWRDGNARPPDLALEKSVCRSGSNS